MTTRSAQTLVNGMARAAAAFVRRWAVGDADDKAMAESLFAKLDVN